MASSLIPQTFWFRVALDCRRLDGMPKDRDKGRLLGLPESCTLPSFRQLDHPTDWVRVQAAWSPTGLGFCFELTEKVGQISAGEATVLAGDSVTLWIDTRDTRNVHRATRFCPSVPFRHRLGRRDPSRSRSPPARRRSPAPWPIRRRPPVARFPRGRSVSSTVGDSKSSSRRPP